MISINRSTGRHGQAQTNRKYNSRSCFQRPSDCEHVCPLALAPCAFYPDYPKLATGSRNESDRMTDNLAFRVADLPQNQPTPFDLRPEDSERRALAEDLKLLGLRKLRFQGDVRASGKKDWALKGTLGATVVQPCVVTLDPVTTRLDVPVERLFTADFEYSEDPEAEMPEDDSIEPLGTHIDLQQIMAEALALLKNEKTRQPTEGMHARL